MKIATLDCGWPDDDDEENDKTVQHIHTHTLTYGRSIIGRAVYFIITQTSLTFACIFLLAHTATLSTYVKHNIFFFVFVSLRFVVVTHI